MLALDHSTSTRLEFSSGTARITLVPPEGRPVTLDTRVLEELDRMLDDIELAAPRLVILQSASERYFCVGADIRALRELTGATMERWIMLGHRVINRLEDLPCPTLAHVSGYALGGGLELILGCDLIYATDTAVFGQPEAKLGFIPGWGGNLRLAERVGQAQANAMIFTGKLIDAEAARHMGLAVFAGTRTEVGAEVAKVQEAILGNSGTALAISKRIRGSGRCAARETNTAAELAGSLKCLAEPDTLRRINEFLSHRSR